MKTVLLDTHAWAWSLTDDRRLSNAARALLLRAEGVFVSPISFFEVGQKVRLGKWPEMAPFVDRLPRLLEKQGGRTAVLGAEICLAGATMDWPHRDPFDRLLAATAMHEQLPLLSAEPIFDTLAGRSGWIARLW
ncbi:MAG: type II toxin-antitoxin system VapC family toxin [Pseudomonadota bacterium]